MKGQIKDREEETQKINPLHGLPSSLFLPFTIFLSNDRGKTHLSQ